MIKVHVVSGFLGAGKTTFIIKFLELLKNQNNVILENEFGEASIDGDIVKKEGYEVMELPSGCICCSLKINFYDALEKIIGEIKPDNIIIEPTGLGQLSEILKILNEEKFRKNCKVESVITIVDGENYLEQNEVFGEFFKDQIINANNLFISKTNKIEQDQLDRIVISLREINKKSYITHKNFIDLSLEELDRSLKSKRIENTDILNKNSLNDFLSEKEMKELKEFISISFHIDNIFSKEKLLKKLKSLKNIEFGEVYRAKGILQGNNNTLEFNYVGGKFTVMESDLKSSNKICVIGKKLNTNKIKLLFKGMKRGKKIERKN